MVRAQVLKLVSLPLWHSLSSGRLKLELHAHPTLAKRWHRLSKKESKAAASNPDHIPVLARPEATFIPSLLSIFLSALDGSTASAVSINESFGSTDAAVDVEKAESTDPNNHDVKHEKRDGACVRFCERFVEFLVDLLSQLPTRRFLRTLLEDKAIVVRCKMSPLFQQEQGNLFAQLVDLFEYYMNFNVDDHTGRICTSAVGKSVNVINLPYKQTVVCTCVEPVSRKHLPVSSAMHAIYFRVFLGLRNNTLV